MNELDQDTSGQLPVRTRGRFRLMGPGLCIGHHGKIEPTRPARRSVSADVVKLASDDMPAHKQPDRLARARAAGLYFSMSA